MEESSKKMEKKKNEEKELKDLDGEELNEYLNNRLDMADQSPTNFTEEQIQKMMKYLLDKENSSEANDDLKKRVFEKKEIVPKGEGDLWSSQDIAKFHAKKG